MPPKKAKATSAAMAHMGSNNGKSKESNHRLDSAGEHEGSLIDLDSDANPDIDQVLVFSELSNTTQESLDTFTNANHAFRDSIKTQVNTLLMAVWSLTGMNGPMGPSPIPPLNPVPVPTTGELVGPFPGPASTSARKLYMPDPPDLANADTDVSEERIPFYLKKKGVEKSPWGSRADAASPHAPQGPPSEPFSEALDDEAPSDDAAYWWVGVGPTSWNKLLGQPQVAIHKRRAASETTQQYSKHLEHDTAYIYVDDPHDIKSDRDHIQSVWHNLNNYARFRGSCEPFYAPNSRENAWREYSLVDPTNWTAPHSRILQQETSPPANATRGQDPPWILTPSWMISSG